MTPVFADSRPFRAATRCVVVLPDAPDDPERRKAWSDFISLLKRESGELTAELGAPVEWGGPAAVGASDACLLIGPASLNPTLRSWRGEFEQAISDEPYVAIDLDRKTVVIDAPTVGQVSEAFQLLRTAIWSESDLLTSSFVSSADDALGRIDAEVQHTFPNLARRAPNWAGKVEEARQQMASVNDLLTIQTLMAHLDDAHSWSKDARMNGRLPYHTMTDSRGCRFWSVPMWSVAWEQGVRPGDVLLYPNAADWISRTGSTPHAKPWLIGYRMLAGRVGDAVGLAARRSDGKTISWTEQIPSAPWREPIEWERLDRNTGYLRIHIWLNSTDWQDAFVAALGELATSDRLIVDLRGNVGGALIAAQDARDRFLKRETHLGSIQYSTVTGDMALAEPIIGRPSSSGPIWTKPVRFLVDPLCYSATEDFLLGLQGLPHVQLIGQTTGGGSGRPRTIALRPHLHITISTALTFDSDGRCIEGNGLAPDIAVVPDVNEPDTSLRQAMQDW